MRLIRPEWREINYVVGGKLGCSRITLESWEEEFPCRNCYVKDGYCKKPCCKYDKWLESHPIRPLSKEELGAIKSLESKQPQSFKEKRFIRL